MSQPRTRPLVSAGELAASLDDPALRIADVRWFLGEPERGREEYAQGHIPGAVFVDLDRDLAEIPGAGRHPLPHPADVAARLGRLGIGDGHRVVAYDASSGMVAARLWWMLDRLGHPGVAVLDGGLRAWVDVGGELSSDAVAHPPTSLTLARSWPDTVDREAVAARAAELDLIDLRAPERYRGEVEPVDRVPGHIPGARNVPARTLLDAHGRLLPAERLRALLEPRDGAVTGRPMVMSCGSGVVACLGILAARLAGLPEPLLYAGSYSDWSAAGRPIETGEAS